MIDYSKFEIYEDGDDTANTYEIVLVYGNYAWSCTYSTLPAAISTLTSPEGGWRRARFPQYIGDYICNLADLYASNPEYFL